MIKESKHDLYRLPLLRRATGSLRALPDFLIIGAQKAGTTTLYDNLVKHPQVRPADIKEVHFFDNNWRKGENWYRGHFDLKSRLSGGDSPRAITGEASPYYLFHPVASQRVKQVCPQARLIVVLRNPTERAYSHYHHEVRKRREPLTFEKAIAQEEQRLAGEEERIKSGAVTSSFAHQHYSYKARGNYARQLENWFQHFPREQFLIIENSALNKDFANSFARIYDFLGLDNFELPAPKRSNVGSYEKMSPESRAMLDEHFAPSNQALYQLVGEDFGW